VNSWLNHHNANEVPSAEQCGLLQPGTSQACKNRTLQRALVAWILVQLLVMQRYFFLQPVIAALGSRNSRWCGYGSGLVLRAGPPGSTGSCCTADAASGAAQVGKHHHDRLSRRVLPGFGRRSVPGRTAQSQIPAGDLARTVDQVDGDVGMRLEVEPPRQFGIAPADHGHGDQVRAVFEVADHHGAGQACPPSGGGNAQGAPTAGLGSPQTEPATGPLIQAAMSAQASRMNQRGGSRAFPGFESGMSRTSVPSAG